MYGEYLEITTDTVMKALGCSRQYVSELVRKGKLIPSGKKGNAYTFHFSELSKIVDTETYLKWIVNIDDLLTGNLPELFEKKALGWVVRKDRKQIEKGEREVRMKI